MAEMTKRVVFVEGSGPRVVLYHVNDGRHDATMLVNGASSPPSDELQRVRVVKAYCDDLDQSIGITIDPNEVLYQINEVGIGTTTDHSMWILCLGTAMAGE